MLRQIHHRSDFLDRGDLCTKKVKSAVLFLNIKSSIYNLYNRITEVPIIISSITRGVCRRDALL